MQEGNTLRDKPNASRVLLLIVVAVIVSLIVLVSATDLLPPPPGPPTPTAPYVLDRPEGLPRVQ